MSGELQTMSLEQLDDVVGGNWLTTAFKAGTRIGGKFVPFVNAAVTAYSAYEAGSAYNDARAKGESVGSSLWEGTKAFVIGR